MDLFNYDPAVVFSFLLTFMRVSIILFLTPFFGGDSVPKTVKAVLCIVLTLGVWPALSFPGTALPRSMSPIMVMMAGELLLGLVVGLVVRFLFGAIQTGGQLIGFQMGYTMVNVVDPLSGENVAVTAHFIYMASLLTFLTLNGHLFLLKAMAESFQLIPPGGLLITERLAQQVFALSAQLFGLAIKIAIPVMAALILVDLALALVARVSPQLNVLILGFPVKISVGFFFLGLMFTVMAHHVGEYIANMDQMYRVLFLAGR